MLRYLCLPGTAAASLGRREGENGEEGDGAALTHITAIFSLIMSLNGEHGEHIFFFITALRSPPSYKVSPVRPGQVLLIAKPNLTHF